MNERIRNILLISAALMVVYLLLFPQRLALEPSVGVAWSLPADRVATLPALAAGDRTVGLRQPDGALFVDEGGVRGSWLEAAEPFGLAHDRLARGADGGRGIEIVGQDGGVIARLAGTGAPWFSGKDLAVLGFGANSLRVHTQAGEFRWKMDTPDLITGYCAMANGDSLVALAGGGIAWLDGQGQTRVAYRPGHGRIPAVYAMAWIEGRRLLAVVADLDPQTLVLLSPRHDAAGYRFDVLETVTLTRQSREPLLMRPVLGDRALVLEQADSLGVLMLDDSLRAVLPLGGRLCQAVGLADASLLVCAVESAEGNQLIGFKPDGRLVFRQTGASRWNDLVLDGRGRLVLDSAAGVQALQFGAR
jgi:hypothetical protein